MFRNKMDQLIWQRHRRMLFAIAILTLLGVVTVSLMALNNIANDRETHNLVSATLINQWRPYNGTYFSAYSMWLILAAWLSGMEMMHLDLSDNFNQFLFSSGFSRRHIYWSKIKVAFAVLLLLNVVATGIEYLIYWVGTPHGYTWTIAWPGVLTSWLVGIIMSIGMFAISWFAAEIIGQSGPLVVTIAGFTVSLSGLAGIGGTILHGSPFSLSNDQVMWTGLIVWLIGALILFFWGAALYQHLSLEHNGEYLLFPHLRVPVYIVFVIYVTLLFSWASDGLSMVVAFVLSALFGYGWLWRPRLGEKWHQWRERN